MGNTSWPGVVVAKAAEAAWDGRSPHRQTPLQNQRRGGSARPPGLRPASNRPSSGKLLEARVTPKVIGWLGLGSGPIPPPAGYETIFQYRCGQWSLWGTVYSGYLLIPEEPTVLYKAAVATLKP